MAGGDPTDVIRSLRRYLALTIGSPPWPVRFGRARVADDARPVAVLEQSGPLGTLQARAGTLAQGDVHKQGTYTLTCYPALAATAEESWLAANELGALIDAGVTRGLVSDETPPRNIGAPFRIPLYDFAGVPITGRDRGGPDEPYSYARVDQSFNVRPIQDALDELRYTVVATLRIDWWQGGRIPPTGTPATSTGGTYAPPPAHTLTGGFGG